MNVYRCLSILGSISLFLLLAAIGGSSAASAQSVDAVISKMKEQYQQQLATVDTYIIKTDEYTSYHRKINRNGEAIYETQTRWKDGDHMFGPGSTPAPHPGLSQLDTLAQHSTYLGTETIAGRETHVLLVDDPSALSGESAFASDDAMEGEMRLYIDTDRYVPLRMEYDLQVEQDGQMQTMRPRVELSDYRTVDGLTLPWKMEMTMNDLNASISPEERAEARRSLEEMETQMKEMPEEQRKMMEDMMGKQLEQLRKIVEDGSINFTVEVQDVRVNAPLPDGVFSNDD